jgi:hypothetical protein
VEPVNPENEAVFSANTPVKYLDDPWPYKARTWKPILAVFADVQLTSKDVPVTLDVVTAVGAKHCAI